jgi:hypothetical protein
LIYLKNGKRIPLFGSRPRSAKEWLPKEGSMIKRTLFPVAIVALSGFLFEAAAADPVIAVKAAKASDLGVARKLVTGSKTDVQFDNLDGTYEFGLAAFDNAQVRHAVHVGALQLKFAK